MPRKSIRFKLETYEKIKKFLIGLIKDKSIKFIIVKSENGPRVGLEAENNDR